MIPSRLFLHLVWLLSIPFVSVGNGQEIATIARGYSSPTASTPNSASPQVNLSNWPYQWKSGVFWIHTTVPEATLRPLADQLLPLGDQISAALDVTLQTGDVHLVVLRDQAEYERYLHTHFPNLPNRRALFVQKRGLSAVLTYCHSDWLIDARHEGTHALLHQSGIKLPVWLDEGIAEYFETSPPDFFSHPVHLSAIQSQLRYGQVVELDELEEHTAEMLDAKGYRDAWSVVAFLLHHSEQSRDGLRTYIDDLHSGTAAGYLSRRLDKNFRSKWREQYTNFYKGLTPTRMVANRIPVPLQREGRAQRGEGSAPVP